ncbi:hypothetical protein J4729_18885 [Leisingera sp. HS039]|uniref:hypothetical protein n=1 Tax=Leisingera sp. HS039 TaxID=2818496 RepID=UPI001B39DDF0|nr:hypothetical protein [Leisingera sp. HS039]MBQ4826594.1 hypothetical protein [Leisingera sp. HS039]
MSDMITPKRLAGILRGHRYPTTTELALQDAIEQRLQDCGVTYERECIMGPKDRIDFLAAGQIGIEAKTRYPRRQIFRQLERYCDGHGLQGLILVTGTYLGLPEQINGVPLFLVSTGRAAL